MTMYLLFYAGALWKSYKFPIENEKAARSKMHKKKRPKMEHAIF